MGRDFWNLKTDQRKLYAVILCIGGLMTILLGIKAFEDTKLPGGYELPKTEVGEGSFSQELVAVVENEKFSFTLEIPEKTVSEVEAKKRLSQAAETLNTILKAENQSLAAITTDICFPDRIEDLAVEVEWTDKLPDYFDSDGMLRQDLEIHNPVEQKVTAILSCQNYTKDYEAVLTILPRNLPIQWKLREQIEQLSKADGSGMKLPKEYEGQTIFWRKPLDATFVCFGILTMAAVIFLKAAHRQDAKRQKKMRQESMEKDYAQIVSKFTMLLSAGLSVRNAWERIVMLDGGKRGGNHPVYEEMNRSMRQMQQGVSELEVYESFGISVGLIHYKKLMALFIMERKRGSNHLLETMNQEMLQALEEQKRKTRQQGEKTGTKLLLPMMGMLAVVFIMILVPAFLSFGL